MPKVTFYVGLAGSGKSHHAQRLQRETGAKLFEGILGDHNEGGRAGSLERLLRWLLDGGDAVIEEALFCIAECRASIEEFLKARVAEVEIDWVYFEKDRDAANWNVENRTEKCSPREIKDHKDINETLYEQYEIPPGAHVIPIHRIPSRDPT